MSIDNLKSLLPEFAKDLERNLEILAGSTVLSEQQLWGTFLASTAATRNEQVLKEISEEAKCHLSDKAYDAALAAATIMAMNNVAFRTRGWLGDDYAEVRMGLRMNVVAKPSVKKVDFELWALAVSTINGCEHCTIAHEKTVREEGLTKQQVIEAVKIAATITGIAQALSI